MDNKPNNPYHSFETALANPSRLALLSEYSSLRCVSESLAFVQAVDFFKTQTKRLALDIFNQFIGPNAPNGINITHQETQSVSALVQQGIFHEAMFNSTRSAVGHLFALEVMPGFTEWAFTRNAEPDELSTNKRTQPAKKKKKLGKDAVVIGKQVDILKAERLRLLSRFMSTSTVGIMPKEKNHWMGKKFTSCFSGSEAVDWLISTGYARRDNSLLLLQAWCDAGIIQPLNSADVQDGSHSFYRLAFSLEDLSGGHALDDNERIRRLTIFVTDLMAEEGIDVQKCIQKIQGAENTQMFYDMLKSSEPSPFDPPDCQVRGRNSSLVRFKPPPQRESSFRMTKSLDSSMPAMKQTPSQPSPSPALLSSSVGSGDQQLHQVFIKMKEASEKAVAAAEASLALARSVSSTIEDFSKNPPTHHHQIPKASRNNVVGESPSRGDFHDVFSTEQLNLSSEDTQNTKESQASSPIPIPQAPKIPPELTSPGFKKLNRSKNNVTESKVIISSKRSIESFNSSHSPIREGIIMDSRSAKSHHAGSESPRKIEKIEKPSLPSPPREIPLMDISHLENVVEFPMTLSPTMDFGRTSPQHRSEIDALEASIFKPQSPKPNHLEGLIADPGDKMKRKFLEEERAEEPKKQKTDPEPVEREMDQRPRLDSGVCLEGIFKQQNVVVPIGDKRDSLEIDTLELAAIFKQSLPSISPRPQAEIPGQQTIIKNETPSNESSPPPKFPTRPQAPTPKNPD